jgi:hypothetical protein
VSGRVLDAQGKGLSGAVVRLLPPTKVTAAAAGTRDMEEVRRLAQIVTIYEEWDTVRPLSSWAESPAAEQNRSAAAEIARAETGADGAFKIEIPTAAGRGPFRLSARVEEIGSASAANVNAGDKVDLILSSGGVVQGRVVAEGPEDPIPGARLVFDSGEREFAAVSDDTGAFRIEGMPPGRFTLRAGAKGRTPILDRMVQVQRGEPVVVKLPQGCLLRIKCTVETDQSHGNADAPIANVEVVALEEGTQVYVIGRTNDVGVAEFAGLPVGTWVVNGRVNGFVSGGDVVVRIEAGKPIVDDEIVFDQAVDTPLEVVDETGLPIAGVEFFTGDGADGYDAVRSEKLPGTTDAQGKWSFPFEFSGPRDRVFGFKKGYGLVQAFPDDNTSGEAMRLVLRKAVRVFGKLTDDQGTGVPNAIVRITFDPKDGDPAIDQMVALVRTDAQGSYDFPYVPAGFEMTIEGESEDSYSDDMPTIEQEEFKSEYQVDLRLERDTSIQEMGPAETRPEPKKPESTKPLEGVKK